MLSEGRSLPTHVGGSLWPSTGACKPADEAGRDGKRRNKQRKGDTGQGSCRKVWLGNDGACQIVSPLRAASPSTFSLWTPLGIIGTNQKKPMKEEDYRGAKGFNPLSLPKHPGQRFPLIQQAHIWLISGEGEE